MENKEEHRHKDWALPGTILEKRGDSLFWKCDCGIEGKIPMGKYVEKLIRKGIIKIKET